MRLLLAGTPSISIPIFEAVLKSDLEIIGVITNPPRAQGRSGAPIPSPVSQWAHENSLEVFESEDDQDFVPKLRDADIVLVVAYGHLIRKELLDIPAHGWVNIHFSHLPQARGAAPVQRLIQSGAESIGFTLFRLETGMDTGPLFYRSDPISISGLTTHEVWNLLAKQAADSIVDLLKKIDNGLKSIPQEAYSGPLALAPKITTEEAKINWGRREQEIVHHVLALNPTPSAWTTFRGERFIIHRAKEVDVSSRTKGLVGVISNEKGEVTVSCGEGMVELLEVQPAGKKRMAASDWARGAQLVPGEKFE